MWWIVVSEQTSWGDELTYFVRAIENPNQHLTLASTVFVGDKKKICARLHFYRAQVQGFAVLAMKKAYPITECLVGEDCFEDLVLAFREKNPSTSGDLGEWGEGFATFIEDIPTLVDAPYLSDVARLEWAVHLAYRAKDIPPLEVDLSDEAWWQSQQLVLAPSVYLVSLKFSVVNLWVLYQQTQGDIERFNEGIANQESSVVEEPEQVLVYRKENHVLLKNLDLTLFAWYQHFTEKRLLVDWLVQQAKTQEEALYQITWVKAGLSQKILICA